MQAPNTRNNKKEDKGDIPLCPPEHEIDWEAMMRGMAPPEWDLLLSAASKNDLNRVRQFVEHENVPVTHSNGIGQTALHVASLWGHSDLVRYLMQAGANVNAANQLSGATPLHTALCSRKLSPKQQADMARLLVEQGQADPVVEDSFGKAPLEYIQDQKQTHPIFQEQQYEVLLKQLTPAPPSTDRLRQAFMKQVVGSMTTCAKIPPK